MSDKYITYQQHEPLRVPDGWNTQEKKLLNQLEEILDDIYRRFGRIRLKDMEPSVREEITETAEGVTTLSTTVEQQGGQITLLAERKLDADAPSVGVTNSAVTIDPNGIDLSTSENGQITSRVGDEIELQIDKEGVTGKKAVFDSVEAPNIVNSFAGGIAPWKGSIQETLDALPKYLNEDTYINIPAGTYSENVDIHGFKGSCLQLRPSGDSGKVTIQGSVSIRQCDDVYLYGVTLGRFEIYPTTATPNAVVFAVSNVRLTISQVNMSGLRNSTRTQYGFFAEATKFRLYDCTIEYTYDRAIGGAHESLGMIYDVAGGGSGTNNSNTGYSILASHGSHLYARGKIPIGTLGVSTWSGTVQQDETTATAGGINYVAPTEYTQSFAITKHCTYLLGWSRTRDDQSALVVQGSYRGTGGNTRFNAGVMWFGGATAALAGKTVISATLTLRRASGGYSNAVPVWLSSTTLAEASYNTTYEPTLTAPTNAGSLSRESSGTFDVTSLMSAILAGGGLAVYESKNTTVTDTWSPAYTQFYAKGSNYEPVLTVKYR